MSPLPRGDGVLRSLRRSGETIASTRDCRPQRSISHGRNLRHIDPQEITGGKVGPDVYASDTAEMATSKDPAAVARSYFASFSTGDPDAVAAHVSDDFVNEHTAALGSGCVGRTAYRERLPGFLTDMAGLEYEVEHVVADGASAAVFYTMRARWQGGTAIEIRGAQRLEVRDGLVSHRVDYWDSKVFLDQLEPGDPS